MSKNLDALRRNVSELEEILKSRKEHLDRLMVEELALTPNSVGSQSEMALKRRNAGLRKELKKMYALAKKFASDPRVIDKRNEVRAVELEIAQVQKDIETLMMMKKRRDIGLREIDVNESKVRLIKGKQNAVSVNLRSTVKELTARLRAIEREDLEAHNHFTRLQEIVKLGVREDDVKRYEREIEQQKKEIKDLQEKESALKERKATARREVVRQLNLQRQECKNLEEEVRELQAELADYDNKLKQSYHHVMRVVGLPATGKTYMSNIK